MLCATAGCPDTAETIAVSEADYPNPPLRCLDCAVELDAAYERITRPRMHAHMRLWISTALFLGAVTLASFAFIAVGLALRGHA